MDLLPALTGAILVLISWVAVSVAVIAVGLAPAVFSLRKIKGARQIDRFVALRHSLWWGLLTLTIWTYAVNL